MQRRPSLRVWLLYLVHQFGINISPNVASANILFTDQQNLRLMEEEKERTEKEHDKDENTEKVEKKERNKDKQ